MDSEGSTLCGPSDLRRKGAIEGGDGQLIGRPHEYRVHYNGSEPGGAERAAIGRDGIRKGRTMTDAPFPEDKIRDADLLGFARTDSHSPTGIIIEVELPDPSVKIGRGTLRGTTARPAIEVAEPTPEQRRVIERTTAQAGDTFERILGRPAHWLWAARAFVAEATPSQIREIANCGFTRAIRANRER